MRTDVILARYGEIGLKSPPVRRRFEQTLQSNIEQAFEQEGVDCIVRRVWGRFLITSSQPEKAAQILQRIFGLTSFSLSQVHSSKLDDLLPRIAEYFGEAIEAKPDAKTFAIRARRSGSHPYSSQDLARQGGGSVLDHPKGQHLKVDLDKPDLEMFVEVRDDKAYLFSQTIRGPGGLPMGSQGRVLVLLKDLHSLVAAWLMLKRGCTIVPVHFDGITGNAQRAQHFQTFLRHWFVRAELIHVPHGETQEFPKDATCVLCMRQMIRKASQLARYKKCKALVTGEAFSSTTVDNLTLFGGLTQMPILRPILGTTPEMVNDFLTAMQLEPSRGLPFFEACPLRTRGRVPEERMLKLEQELNLPQRAHESVRARERPPGATT